MRALPWFAVAALALGCSASQTPAVQTAPPPAPAAPVAATPQPPPSGTRRVSGEGWSAVVPDDWTEATDERGVTQWRGPISDGRAERRVLSVQVIRAAEPFEQIVAEVPVAYRQRGATAEEPRVFDHQGRRSAEVEVHQPAQLQQFPMYLAILVEGRRGVVVSCGGEPGAELERLCHGVIDSAWFGAAGAQPRAAAPEGMRWFGRGGRFVQAPAAWQPMAGHSDGAAESIGVADEGERHAIVLHFLDDLTGTPQQAIEGGRRGFEQDQANTIVHTTPIRSGRRQGLFIEGTRGEATRAATTLLQWIVPAGPGAFYTVNVAGPADDVAGHRDLYQSVLESFTPTR